eukprot:240803_1
MGNALLEVDLGSGFNVTDIVPGGYHTCALSTLNKIKCWGWNVFGELGYNYGDTNNRGDGGGEMGNALLEVDLGTGFNLTDIVPGGLHRCALSTLNKIKCWGWNVFGELGYNYGDTNNINTHGQLGYGDKYNRGDGPG